MHASKDQLPILLQAGEAAIRGVDWGGMRVSLVSVPAGTDFGPLLKGLENDRCPGPHWGIILKGRLCIEYGDHTEVLQAGDFYHMPPDHTGVAEADTEFLEIAPPEQHERFLENARRNLAAAGAA